MSPMQQAFLLDSLAEFYREDSRRLQNNPKMSNDDAQFVIADADISAALAAIAAKIRLMGNTVH